MKDPSSRTIKCRRALSRIIWILPLLAALLIGCASNQRENWVEATDYGVMPTYRKPAEARAKARNVAIEHARQQLFDTVCAEQITPDLTVGRLALLDPEFRSKLAGMISSAKPEEVRDQPKGIVAIKVGIDKAKVMELAKKHQLRVTLPKPAAAPEQKTAPADSAVPADNAAPKEQPAAPADANPIQWDQPKAPATAPAPTPADNAPAVKDSAK